MWGIPIKCLCEFAPPKGVEILAPLMSPKLGRSFQIVKDQQKVANILADHLSTTENEMGRTGVSTLTEEDLANPSNLKRKLW